MMQKTILTALAMVTAIAGASSLAAEEDYLVSRKAILANCKQRKAVPLAEDRCLQAIMAISMMAMKLKQQNAFVVCLSPDNIEKAADLLIGIIEAHPIKAGNIGDKEKLAVGQIILCKS